MSSSPPPVRVALVGLGGHGRTIQQAVEAAPNLQVVTVYDVDEAEARAAAGRFQCETAASFEELLAQEGLEAVALVTPNHLHRRQAAAAFAAGLHVFVEKPIANTVAEGRSMVEAAERAGCLLMVGHNMRFGPAARQAREALQAGRLGRVVSVEIHFSSDTVRRLNADAWRLHPDQGPLLPVLQLGIHAIDLVHDLVGPIREVHAFTQSVLAPGEAVDSVAAAFRIEEGSLGTMVSHYCTPVLFEYRITGTEGILQCTPHRYRFRRRGDWDETGDGPAEERDPADQERISYVRQMQAFGEAVRQGKSPAADGWAGLQALAVVEAFRRSADAGTPQPVPDVRIRQTG